LQENAISGLPFTELGHWLYQRTEGNPLFMVTMVEHLLREGILAGEPSVAAKPLPLPERASALVERVQELREELAEAESFHDVGRVARLQAELEAVTESLVQQQTRSQQKASPSPDERLRLNVTRAIKTAIKKIASVHPLLGRYLTQTIKTGTTCSYTPPDSFSID
jgi:non-specific serine/threonine protein kinase